MDETETVLLPGSSKPLRLERKRRKPWVLLSCTFAAVVLAIAAGIGLLLQPKTNDPPVVQSSGEPKPLVSENSTANDQSLASLVASAETLKNSVKDLGGVVDDVRENEQSLAGELKNLKEYVVQRRTIPDEDKNQVRAEDLLSDARRLLSAKDYDGAIAALVFARRLQPADTGLGCDELIEAHCQMGWRRMDDLQYALADGEFDQAVTIAQTKYGESIPPQVVKRALFGRGVARLHAGILDKAVKDFSYVIQVVPNSSTTLVQRGIAFTRIGNHKAALADFDEAIRLDSNSYAGFNNRGACYLNLRMNAEAIKDFTAAVKLNDQIADGFYNRHIAYRRIGDKDKSASDLAQAAKIDPSIRAPQEKSPLPNEGEHSVLKPANHKSAASERRDRVSSLAI